MEAVRSYAVPNPKEMAGNWQAYARREWESSGMPVPKEGPVDIYLEMGCGRGQFLVKQAQAHPDCFYVGAEGRTSIAVRCLELIQAGGAEREAAGGNDFRDEAHREEWQKKLAGGTVKAVPNARCIAEFVDRVEDYFAPGELSGIYCNFSDPWPKNRHEKRRLTSRNFLEGYKRALKPGGFIAIKTDNDDLFAFTLEVIDELRKEGKGYVVEELSYDLHRSDLAARLVTTQYEERFMELGVPIKYCRIRFASMVE